MSEDYKVSYKTVEGIPIIYFEGDMTSESDQDVMAVYEEITNEIDLKYLIINFEKTTYINSAGIATLINIIQDIGEDRQRVAFVGLVPHFEKVMKIVGITDFVKLCETDDQAIKAFS